MELLFASLTPDETTQVIRVLLFNSLSLIKIFYSLFYFKTQYHRFPSNLVRCTRSCFHLPNRQSWQGPLETKVPSSTIFAMWKRINLVSNLIFSTLTIGLLSPFSVWQSTLLFSEPRWNTECSTQWFRHPSALLWEEWCAFTIDRLRSSDASSIVRHRKSLTHGPRWFQLRSSGMRSMLCTIKFIFVSYLLS